MIESHKMLCLSTAHVSRETASALDGDAVGDAVVYPKADYGWFLPLTVDTATDCADLANVIRFARANGFDWLMLDCDGPTVDGLPTFDW